ncbi:MAG: hypothetical protein HQL30_10025 [Candidatus Omnitrophica bacterium]|nr:hypothetical protein [Candidatus Omnitrophota bacterium]
MPGNNTIKAEIDGKDVPVEIIDEVSEPKRRDGGSRAKPAAGNWKLFLPLIATGIVLVLFLVASLTLFVWALPVLVPLFLIWFVVNVFVKR